MAYSVGVHRVHGPTEITKRGLFYCVLIAYSFITAIPFFWALATSFKSLPESNRPPSASNTCCMDRLKRRLHGRVPSVLFE